MVEEFLSYLSSEKNRALNTILSYRSDIELFQNWLKRKKLDLLQVTSVEINEFLAQTKKNHSQRSIARLHSCLRQLYKFLQQDGYISKNPLARTKAIKTGRKLPETLSLSQVERLIEQIDPRNAFDLRDRAMLEMAYGSGLRISELIALDIDEVDLRNSTILILGKGSKERLVPMGTKTKIALQNYLAKNGRGYILSSVKNPDLRPLFINARGRRLTRQGAWFVFKKWAKRAGLDNVFHPHILRHSCATHMLENGADIRVVQELLGHSSLSTTQIYTLVSSEHLRSVYLKSHPRAKR